MDDDTDTDGHIRLYVTRGQAASFCEQPTRSSPPAAPIASGAATPIDPDGHPCPRMN